MEMLSAAAASTSAPQPDLHPTISSESQSPSPSSDHPLPGQSVKAGKQREQLREPQSDSHFRRPPKRPSHRKSSSVDLFPPSAKRRDSSWTQLWNPLNSSSSAVTLHKSARGSSRATSSTHQPTIRKSKSLPLRPESPTTSEPSSLIVETSNETSTSNSPPIAAPKPPEPPARTPSIPPNMATDSTGPSIPDKDPERDASKPLSEIPWGPAHPCFPHPNPHVPLTSPLHSTTRIIRIKRDWMIAGDLAPTFSNIYPEILEPWVSDADFRDLVQNVNDRLIKAFHPSGWRAWFDAIMGLATGWIWEDSGFSAVKKGLRDTEEWIERWNGREGKMAAEGEADSAKVVPLRRTGYLSIDIQIPDPQVRFMESSASKPESKHDSRPASPQKES